MSLNLQRSPFSSAGLGRLRGRVHAFALTALTAAALITAGAPPAQAAPLSTAEYEATVGALVNQARQAHGLPPLTVTSSLSVVARNWSQKMADKLDISHNPVYSSQYPTGWTWAAENVAMGWNSEGQYSPQAIHKALMDSPSHRANILSSSATHVGLGVVLVRASGRNYAFLTENFARYPAGVRTTSPAAAIVTPKVPFAALALSPDLDGDAVGDVLATDASGRLFRFPGNGRGGVTSPRAYGTGWSGLRIYTPGDWNGDRRSDVLAQDGDGKLWLYPGDGRGGLGARKQIGSGWSPFRVVPAGDVNGDRRADLLAVDSAGRLWLYPGDGRGGFDARRQVGNGWSTFELYAAGDMNKDGKVDIVGVDGSGRLFFYAGRGGGSFMARKQTGSGWSGYTLLSGADLNRNGVSDLLGRDTAGRLFFYNGARSGTYATKVQVGNGW